MADRRSRFGVSLNVMLFGVMVTAGLTIMNYYIIEFRWNNFFGLLFAGYCMLLLGWGSDRLWYTTIGGMVKNSFPIFKHATRLPFWYFAGGMGYTLGMLIAKKYGLLMVYDVPVKLLFRFGGIAGCVVQMAFQMAEARSSIKNVSFM